MCGADFPLKVSALGESSPLVGYADDPRPPGSIPNSAQMPRWPINQPQYAPPAPIPSAAPASAQPIDAPRMRWVPGPSPAERPNSVTPAGRPIPLSAPSAESGVASGAAPLPDDIPDDAVPPPGRTYSPPPQRAYGTPVYQPPQRTVPSLGSARGRQTAGPMTPAVLTPPATLACPIVSALDHWVSEGVQPAAMRWFGTPVTEIKQISAYSCRGMVGSGGSGISEHAFGNAIDIAAFTLSDGRRVTVEAGWHGTPEEQGFLARRPSCRLRSFFDGAGAGLQRCALQPYPCRSDAPCERRPSLPARSDVWRGRRSKSAGGLCHPAARPRVDQRDPDQRQDKPRTGRDSGRGWLPAGRSHNQLAKPPRRSSRWRQRHHWRDQAANAGFQKSKID